MSLDSEIVVEVAAEMGVSSAFVEKDWYSVQVLKAIAVYQGDAVETLFSGGTSLSKGYGVIQRFSEDLDFRCRYRAKGSNNQNRKKRSNYRLGIVSSIRAIESIELDESMCTGQVLVDTFNTATVSGRAGQCVAQSALGLLPFALGDAG